MECATLDRHEMYTVWMRYIYNGKSRPKHMSKVKELVPFQSYDEKEIWHDKQAADIRAMMNMIYQLE